MDNKSIRDAILRIGDVSGIEGRKVIIRVDKNKNSSDLLFEGKVIKNVSVGSYVEIKKGFLSIIGKVDGEKLTEDTRYIREEDNQYREINKNYRFLTLSLVGYIGADGRFYGGIKELPLIGDEAFILTDKKIYVVHNLLKDSSSIQIQVAQTEIEEIPVTLPVDGLFNSHIAIFGNTGSGKSNTLAALYQGLFDANGSKKSFLKNCKFLLLDFNGEYIRPNCITKKKKLYNLNTQNDDGDKIPMSFSEFFDVETLSILVDATEKTQKPFLKRALKFYKTCRGKNNFSAYLKAVVQNKITEILKMANKDIADKLLDYMEEVLGLFVDEDTKDNLQSDIRFHGTRSTFYFTDANNQVVYFNGAPERIAETNIYQAADFINDETLNALSYLSQFWVFLHLQLIEDLFRYKVQNDHIYPVINRTKAKQSNIERIFEIEEHPSFWGDSNCVVINLHDANLDMKKTLPLLLAKSIYNAHKKENNKKSLNIIVDEAHNILSKASFRETEEWKDYRLETFEEIIKEGRKFGVFMTIASQRPSDISDTIISQAHNYFIHQLINQRDLAIIGNAVSYIDKITEESIPTLPVGTCIFSGIATPMPLKLKIIELPNNRKPHSLTLKFSDLIGK